MLNHSPAVDRCLVETLGEGDELVILLCGYDRWG